MVVRTVDGHLLYTHRNDYTLDLSPLNLEEMLVLSKKFLGIPYLWGGTNSLGFDCSGFVQMLYEQAGIQLPKNSREQANFSASQYVEKKDLIPGDLLFFGEKEVNHVGLYLGNNEFIHAFAGDEIRSSCIQLSSLEEEKWQELFWEARRYYFQPKLILFE